MDTFFGKYRGVVADVADPLMQGRLRVRVPAVLGEAVSGWALPCIPFGVPLSLPMVGAAVWIEFEGGDPRRPICCGGLTPTVPAPEDPQRGP